MEDLAGVRYSRRLRGLRLTALYTSVTSPLVTPEKSGPFKKYSLINRRFATSSKRIAYPSGLSATCSAESGNHLPSGRIGRPRDRGGGHAEEG